VSILVGLNGLKYNFSLILVFYKKFHLHFNEKTFMESTSAGWTTTDTPVHKTFYSKYTECQGINHLCVCQYIFQLGIKGQCHGKVNLISYLKVKILFLNCVTENSIPWGLA
jgi:hypothetical protein